MKKMAAILMMALLVVASLGCGKTGAVSGKWARTESDGKQLILELSGDGKFTLSSPDISPELIEEGTFTLDGTAIEMFSSSGELIVKGECVVEKDTLTLTLPGEVQEFTRTK